MNILYKSFHLVDVDNERTVRNDISEDFDSFINDFVDFQIIMKSQSICNHA